MQIDAKQHQHFAAAVAKVILYQSAGELTDNRFYLGQYIDRKFFSSNDDIL